MGVQEIIILMSIGFVGSFIAGMVGIGGAIIKYPMLLLIPPLFHMRPFTSHEVAGISAIDVLFVSIAAVIGFRNSGFLNKKLIVTMGISIVVGTFIGSYFSQLLTENMLNFVYTILATFAVLLMLFRKKNSSQPTEKDVHFNKPLAAISAFLVGISAGIVGAGGSFLLIPIMISLLRIPTKVAIASSVAITVISAFASSIGKIVTDQVEYAPAIVLVISGMIAAPIGAKVATKINARILERLLAILLFFTALKMWFSYF